MKKLIIHLIRLILIILLLSFIWSLVHPQSLAEIIREHVSEITVLTIGYFLGVLFSLKRSRPSVIMGFHIPKKEIENQVRPSLFRLIKFKSLFVKRHLKK